MKPYKRFFENEEMTYPTPFEVLVGYMDKAGTKTPENIKKLKQAISNKFLQISWQEVEERLEIVDKLIGGFGIEGDADYDIFYVNVGDTYATTVVFHDGRFEITSWGDIVEEVDAQKARGEE